MRETAVPRTIITTDPELDDLNSLIRALLWSNEIPIDGLVHTSSRWHWAGDERRGIAPFRWPAEGVPWHIEEVVEAYAQAHPNLLVHDSRYPAPERLRGLIARGNIAAEGDVSESTAGSALIAEALVAGEDPLFLQAWGGTNTIARALLDVERDHAGTEGWSALRRRIQERVVVTGYEQQDRTFAEVIRPRWPDLEFRDVATDALGYRLRAGLPERLRHLLEPRWMAEHISTVGPLGAAYRVWGDGRSMSAQFDPGDYLGLPERPLTAEDLERRGYTPWSPVHAAGSWTSEGDTSNAALLVDNGLRSWESPGFGGWGGRQVPVPREPASFEARTALEADEQGGRSAEWGTWRWFEAMQNDLAGRLRWSVSPRWAQANHHPHIRVSGGLDRSASPGGTLDLHVDVQDPDGDATTVRWWHYAEAGSAREPLDLVQDGDSVRCRIPEGAAPGTSFHLIAEATDGGTPPLTRYARVVLTVAEP